MGFLKLLRYASPARGSSSPRPSSPDVGEEGDRPRRVFVGTGLCGRPVPKAATRPGRPHRAAPTFVFPSPGEGLVRPRQIVLLHLRAAESPPINRQQVVAPL